jgi:hypothetical protein
MFYSCQKGISEDKQMEFPQNKTLIINSSNFVDVRTSDISSDFSTFKRKIEIIDKKDNSIFKTFILTVTSEKTNESVYESLKSKKFTGSLIVESDGAVILKFQSLNGKSAVPYNLNSKSETNLSYETHAVPCSLKTVHDCVSFKIHDFNWIEYGLYLAEAPLCYAGLWASCSWNVCVKHKQYQNPIH